MGHKRPLLRIYRSYFFKSVTASDSGPGEPSCPSMASQTRSSQRLLSSVWMVAMVSRSLCTVMYQTPTRLGQVNNGTVEVANHLVEGHQPGGRRLLLVETVQVQIDGLAVRARAA